MRVCSFGLRRLGLAFKGLVLLGLGCKVSQGLLQALMQGSGGPQLRIPLRTLHIPR